MRSSVKFPVLGSLLCENMRTGGDSDWKFLYGDDLTLMKLYAHVVLLPDVDRRILERMSLRDCTRSHFRWGAKNLVEVKSTVLLYLHRIFVETLIIFNASELKLILKRVFFQ